MRAIDAVHPRAVASTSPLRWSQARAQRRHRRPRTSTAGCRGARTRRQSRGGRGRGASSRPTADRSRRRARADNRGRACRSPRADERAERRVIGRLERDVLDVLREIEVRDLLPARRSCVHGGLDDVRIESVGSPRCARASRGRDRGGRCSASSSTPLTTIGLVSSSMCNQAASSPPSASCVMARPWLVSPQARGLVVQTPCRSSARPAVSGSVKQKRRSFTDRARQPRSSHRAPRRCPSR